MNTKPTQTLQRWILPSIIVVAAAIGVTAFPETARANVEVYQKTLKSTTWIIRPDGQGLMTGSGVLIDRDKKLVLTNWHVVGEEREVTVFFPQYKEGKLIAERSHYLERQAEIGIKGRVIAIDRKRDLGLVQLPSLPDGVQAIEFSPENAVAGQDVQSVGSPVASESLFVYTSGTVRSVYRKHFRTQVGEHEFTVVETSSPINPGDSGGPLVNAEGKLIGISQAMNEQARLISYHVDLSEIKGLLAEDWKPAPVSIADLMDKTGLKYSKHATGPYAVEFPVEGGNPLSIFIGNNTEYYGKAEVRKIWSLAGKTKEAPTVDAILSLLQQNGRVKMGAWTVEKNTEGEYMLIFCVQIDATASAEAVKSAMEYVSKITLAMSKAGGSNPAVANK